MNPGKFVGRAIRVYWEDDDEWYSGTVDNYHPDRGWHVQYYDGEEEWLTSMDKNVAFDDPIDETISLHTTIRPEVPLGSSDLIFTSELEIANDNQSKPSKKLVTNHTDNFPTSSNRNSRSQIEGDNLRGWGSAEIEITAPSRNRRHDADPIVRSQVAADVDGSVTSLRGSRDNADVYQRRNYKDGGHRITDNAPEERSNISSSYNGKSSNLDVPSKGLLLIGTVFGASNLPIVDQNEIDGKCMFRVLYVEGTGQSSMFRCKTPIFSSKVTEDLQFPQWGEEGTFRFEVIMPDNRENGGELKLQGQILVALYRRRGQGGSEFLGQVCFELTDLTTNGVKDSHQMGVEARSVTGEYPLIDRFDKIVGNYAEVRISLQVAWRPESFFPEESSFKNVPRQNISAGVRPQSQGGNRSVSGRDGGGSVAGTLKTFGASRATNVRPSSAVPPTKGMSRGPPPIKMVSARLRKQVDDKRRIDAQNKLMQSKLQAKGTRGRGDTVTNIYCGPTSNAEAKQRSSSASSKRGAKRSEVPLASLMDTWTQMKRDVAEIEEENTFLKATLTKLKTHTRRHEITTDRLKKQTKPSSISEFKCDAVAFRNESIREQKLISQEEEDEEISNIVDNELREVVIEHSNLQQLRRGLIERAKVASMTQDDHVTAASNAQDEESMLRSRIAMLAPFAVSKGASDAVSSEQRVLQDTIVRLHNVQLDFLCAEAAKEYGFHFGPLLDAIEEDRELVILLRKKQSDLQSEVEKCRNDQDDTKDRLRVLNEEKSVYKVRDRITDLRLELFQLRKTQCLEAIQIGSSSIEREVLRISLKA